MSKYRSYKFVKRNVRSKNLKIVKICVAVTLVVLVVKYHRILGTVTEKFNKLIAIEEVIIVKNDTTLSEDLLKQRLGASKNVFGFYRIVKSLKKDYPEIKQLKIIGLPLKVVKIKVFSETPFCYSKFDNGQIKLYSKDKGWYSVNDVSKLQLEDLIEFQDSSNGKYDINAIEKICQMLLKAGLTKKIVRFTAYKNGEFKLVVKNTSCVQEVIVDSNIVNVDIEKISRFVSYLNNSEGRIYARLIKEGRIYVEYN